MHDVQAESVCAAAVCSLVDSGAIVQGPDAKMEQIRDKCQKELERTRIHIQEDDDDDDDSATTSTASTCQDTFVSAHSPAPTASPCAGTPQSNRIVIEESSDDEHVGGMISAQPQGSGSSTFQAQDGASTCAAEARRIPMEIKSEAEQSAVPAAAEATSTAATPPPAHPGDPPAHPQQITEELKRHGNDAYARKDNAAAKQLYNQSADAYPAHAAAHANQAVIALQEGCWDVAIQKCTLVLELGAAELARKALLRRGRARAELDDFDGASRDMQVTFVHNYADHYQPDHHCGAYAESGD
jgi:hypothetical protein